VSLREEKTISRRLLLLFGTSSSFGVNNVCVEGINSSDKQNPLSVGIPLNYLAVEVTRQHKQQQPFYLGKQLCMCVCMCVGGKSKSLIPLI